MKRSMVRCWKLDVWRNKKTPDEIYISYPEDNSGYDLLSCLNCGHIYAASVATQVYVGPPIQEILKRTSCLDCGKSLEETASPYPDKYLTKDGVMIFSRPVEIPLDEESTIKEFDELY